MITCNKARCTCTEGYDADDEFSDFDDSPELEDEADCEGYYSAAHLQVRDSVLWEQSRDGNLAISGYDDELMDEREVEETYVAKAPPTSDAQPGLHLRDAISQHSPMQTAHSPSAAPSSTPNPETRSCPEDTRQCQPPATGSARAFVDFIKTHGLHFPGCNTSVGLDDELQDGLELDGKHEEGKFEEEFFVQGWSGEDEEIEDLEEDEVYYYCGFESIRTQ